MPPMPDPDFFTAILPIMLMGFALGVGAVIIKGISNSIAMFVAAAGALFLAFLFLQVVCAKIVEKVSATIAQWQEPAEEMLRRWPEFILFIIGVIVLGALVDGARTRWGMTGGNDSENDSEEEKPKKWGD